MNEIDLFDVALRDEPTALDRAMVAAVARGPRQPEPKPVAFEHDAADGMYPFGIHPDEIEVMA